MLEDGFKGHMNTSKYAQLAKCSSDIPSASLLPTTSRLRLSSKSTKYNRGIWTRSLGIILRKGQRPRPTRSGSSIIWHPLTSLRVKY